MKCKFRDIFSDPVDLTNPVILLAVENDTVPISNQLAGTRGNNPDREEPLVSTLPEERVV